MLTISDVEARLIEIAENLHRNELTALERSEQIAEWLELTDGVLSQDATKPIGRPESGVRKAARSIGIDKDEAHRAADVASLSPEAKETAKIIGLDDNRSALLEAARKPQEDQAETLKAIKDAR